MRTNADREITMELLPDLSQGEEAECIEAGSSLEFLQSVYRAPYQPISRRMRAAIAALPFEYPKLSVSANLGVNAGFAMRLEQARKRSESAKIAIDAVPVADDLSSCD
jgi:hypothetical protein